MHAAVERYYVGRDAAHRSVVWKLLGALVSIFSVIGTAHAAAALDGGARCHGYGVETFPGGSSVIADLYCTTVVPVGTAPGPGERAFVPGETYTNGIGNFNPNLAASYAYRSTYGDLGVETSGSANGLYYATDTGSTYGTQQAYVDSSTWVSMQDTITLTSADLPLGAPVRFTLMGDAQGSVTGQYGSTGAVQGSAGAGLLAFVSLVGPTGGQVSFCANLAESFCNSSFLPFGQSYALTFDAHVGDVFHLYASLSADAVISYPPGGLGSFSANLAASSFHSLEAFLRADTAGLGFTTDSGHDYTPAVPEPSSGALALAGLVALAFAARRLQQSSRGDPVQ